MTNEGRQPGKPPKSRARRVLNGVSTLALLISASVLIFGGSNAVALLVTAMSLTSIGISAAVTGASFFGFSSALIETLLDGISAIFEAIGSVLSSIFN